ncbi:PucR family transcriptional regulator [Nocardioides terrisoli]|uniref:PucR family transcriptional regulator n=1 Tax=Nocardioides terrisoli TaxID=3388267 RepID=UPI00287B9CD3|nr:helix-turn-helix domain-containing protein [Nocardioides marmorisolisilvae]
MTDHNVPRLSGRPVDELIDRLRDDLIAEILDRLAAVLPVYATLPRSHVEAEVRRACTRGIRLFASALRCGELDDRALQHARRGAARRAEDSVPLGQLVAAYCLGVEICHDRLMQLARPEDLATVLDLQRLSLRFLREVSAALAEGYAETHELLRDDEMARRHALLDALLSGDDVDAAATRAGARLPVGYFVLAIGFRLETDPEIDIAVLARRTARQIRQELGRHLPGSVLSRLSETGGVVLVPLDRLDPAEEEWDRLQRLVGTAGRVARARLTVAAVPAGIDAVGDAAHLAEELLELVGLLGRGPGVHRLDDMALEYQLTRHTPARPKLAAALAPLADDPDLLVTLRTYLAEALSRRRTADQLGVHPNTVDNRLRRVSALTGLDVARGVDLPLITAALAALPS